MRQSSVLARGVSLSPAERKCHEDLNADFRPEEVVALRKTAKLDSALGPDGFLPHWVRHCVVAEKLGVRAAGMAGARLLCHLFNNSWRSGFYPLEWSKANVAPLFKGKPGSDLDPADADNYRPISLTSVLSKYMERLVQRRLVGAIRHRLHKNQFGFRNRYATTDAVYALLRTAQKHWSNLAEAEQRQGNLQ
jgi:hypothetical protein